MAEVAVTPADSRRVVAVKVGDTISVRLPENPTTGYSWAIDSIDAQRLEADAPAYQGEGAGLGTGGAKTWRFVARAPGRTRLGLKRWRHWEGDASIVERFAVTLDIKPD
jgi:inhibitor of cysteine peptidase